MKIKFHPRGEPSLDTIKGFVNEAIENILNLDEKWKGDVKVDSTGEWSGKTLEQLRARHDALMDQETRTKEEQEEVAEINFAIRAKTGWKKGKGAAK